MEDKAVYEELVSLTRDLYKQHDEAIKNLVSKSERLGENELIKKIIEKVERLDKTVQLGNGKPALVDSLAEMKYKIQTLEAKNEELEKQKLNDSQTRRAVLIAVITAVVSLAGTILNLTLK